MKTKLESLLLMTMLTAAGSLCAEDALNCEMLF